MVRIHVVLVVELGFQLVHSDPGRSGGFFKLRHVIYHPVQSGFVMDVLRQGLVQLRMSHRPYAQLLDYLLLNLVVVSDFPHSRHVSLSNDLYYQPQKFLHQANGLQDVIFFEILEGSLLESRIRPVDQVEFVQQVNEEFVALDQRRSHLKNDNVAIQHLTPVLNAVVAEHLVQEGVSVPLPHSGVNLSNHYL